MVNIISLTFDVTVILRHKIARRHRTFRFYFTRSPCLNVGWRRRPYKKKKKEKETTFRRLRQPISHQLHKGGGHLLLRAGRDYCWVGGTASHVLIDKTPDRKKRERVQHNPYSRPNIVKGPDADQNQLTNKDRAKKIPSFINGRHFVPTPSRELLCSL